ncbi:MAG: outer membrane lipoprotein chaperone LolA [Acidobacteriota bacterium]
MNSFIVRSTGLLVLTTTAFYYSGLKNGLSGDAAYLLFSECHLKTPELPELIAIPYSQLAIPYPQPSTLNRSPLPLSPIFQPIKYLSLSDVNLQRTDLGGVIDGLQRKYSRMTTLEASFLQVYQAQDGRIIRESGSLILKRPGKARWDYHSPEKKIFVSDGKNIFFYVFGEAIATKTSIRNSSDPQIPFLFLLGRGDLRRDFSRIESLNSERAVEAGNWILRLVPQKAPEEFRKLLVEVNPNNFSVKRLIIFERSGARMDFVLSNVRENVKVSDSQFQFSPPPGVAIKQQ